jgi:ABC-type transport system involved in cytochrome c biogenesis permease subunit
MGSLYATPWMVVHVTFAWLAFGSYALAAAASLLLLLHKSVDRKFPDRLPPAEKLDLTSYRLIVLGVINQTLMLASGAIWAKKAWGHYWSWAPLEAWSLLSYLLYVFYLHVRRFLGWKMARTAWIAAFGLVILTISYWGIKWLGPTLHPGP